MNCPLFKDNHVLTIINMTIVVFNVQDMKVRSKGREDDTKLPNEPIQLLNALKWNEIK